MKARSEPSLMPVGQLHMRPPQSWWCEGCQFVGLLGGVCFVGGGDLRRFPWIRRARL